MRRISDSATEGVARVVAAAALAAKPWQALPASRITSTEGRLRDLKPMNRQRSGSFGSQLLAKCRHCQQFTSAVPVRDGLASLATVRDQMPVRFNRAAYCSSFMTVWVSVLACASTAVAACCMIWVRASSVLAAA